MQKLRFLMPAPFVLLLCGCSRGPDWYAPPVQREPLAVVQPSFIGPFATMSDPNAESYLVKDVSRVLEGGAWRWAYQRPELRFYLAGTNHVRFVMEFALPERTFHDTGPVTLSIAVNGSPLGRQRFDKAGTQKLEMSVPAGLLKAGAINQVSIEPDKVWHSPDGARMGFVLTAAGFQE